MSLSKLACIGLLMLQPGFAAEVRLERDSAPAAEVHVTECRIKLIEQATLASDRTGILEFIECKEGDLIEAEQKVAGLEDDLIIADLKAAEHKATNDIEIRAAKKAHELAETEVERATEANRTFKNTVPYIELRRFELGAEKAALDIKLAEHELILNRLQRDFKRTELGTYVISAPFSGVITKIYKKRGEAVRQGDPIVEITNIDLLRVEGWVELDQAWKIALGDRVNVRANVSDAELPVEDQVYEGRITFIDVAVEPVTRKRKIFAEVVNLDHQLLAGLTADMTIEVDPTVQRKDGAAITSRTVRRPATGGGGPAPAYQRPSKNPATNQDGFKREK